MASLHSGHEHALFSTLSISFGPLPQRSRHARHQGRAAAARPGTMCKTIHNVSAKPSRLYSAPSNFPCKSSKLCQVSSVGVAALASTRPTSTGVRAEAGKAGCACHCSRSPSRRRQGSTSSRLASSSTMAAVGSSVRTSSAGRAHTLVPETSGLHSLAFCGASGCHLIDGRFWTTLAGLCSPLWQRTKFSEAITRQSFVDRGRAAWPCACRCGWPYGLRPHGDPVERDGCLF